LHDLNDAPINYPRGIMSIIHDMPAEQYHATDAVSNGMLTAMAESPYHCWAKFHNPNRPQSGPTPAMKAGTLLHTALLEPWNMGGYVVRPDDVDPRTKAGKEWAAMHAGLGIITAEQHDTVKQQIKAIHAVPTLHELLCTAGAVAESSVFWVDAATGLNCRARPDLMVTNGRRVTVLDVKSTADASPDGFGKSTAKFGYHRQAAHYTNGIEAQGLTVDAFVFATVTSSYPFIAVAYVLDAEAAAQGFEEAAELLDLYGTCKAANNWPAYGQGLQPLSLPKWAQRSNEIEVTYAPL
jgi:exodeoxyribonuclease VIII